MNVTCPRCGSPAQVIYNLDDVWEDGVVSCPDCRNQVAFGSLGANDAIKVFNSSPSRISVVPTGEKCCEVDDICSINVNGFDLSPSNFGKIVFGNQVSDDGYFQLSFKPRELTFNLLKTMSLTADEFDEITQEISRCVPAIFKLY